MKKIISILTIVLLAIIAVCPLSFAANNLTLTVTGDVAGRTLSVYKLFNLTVEDNDNYHYSWDGLASEGFFTSKGYANIYQVLEELRNYENDSTSLTNLALEYYNFCTDPANSETLANKTSRIDVKTVGEDERYVEFTGLDEGYYLVYDETENPNNTTSKARSAAILSSLIQSEEVKIKTDDIHIEKETDVTTANIGENVNFTITTEVPRMIGYDKYEFNVEDAMSKGLDFNDDIEITIGGQIYTNATISKITNANGTTSLEIKFNDFISQKDNAGAEIKITYSAKLNSEAAIEKDNTNQVKLIYSNDPKADGKGESTPDIVHVYSFTFDITKKNSKDETLNGAKFILKLSNGKYATFDENGKLTGEVENKEDATVLTSSGKKEKDGAEVDAGKIQISGLKEGTYTLIETEAPEGYNTPNFEFVFKITPRFNDDGILEDADFEYLPMSNSANGYVTGIQTKDGVAEFTIDILNAKKGLLPSTGGMGTTLFTTAGIVLMISALGVFVIKMKKNKSVYSKEN